MLKDELYANIDEEIDRLERLYNFSADFDSEQAKIYFVQTNFQRSSKPVKRRNSKGQSKVEIQGDSKNWIKTPNKHDEFLEMEKESNSYPDDNDEDSNYSYPENLNMKLFTIEKVVKKKPGTGTKRAKLTSYLNLSKHQEMEKRKDSIAVQSSVSTALSKSPKTDLINTEGLLNKSHDKYQDKVILSKSEEKETIPPNNENGWWHRVVESESFNIRLNEELKVKFRKELLVKDNDTLILEEHHEEPQTWKALNYVRLEDSWFPKEIFNLGMTSKIHQEEDYEQNNFDRYFDFNFMPNKLQRKMTRDESILQINNLEESVLMGDRKFPLFHLY